MDCPNKPTIEELEKLRDEKLAIMIKENNIAEEEKKRYELAVLLDICPCCGSPIVSETREILDKPKKYVFGLIVKKHEDWDYRKICSKDKSHYENKGYFPSYDIHC